MSKIIPHVESIYAAFGRGDVPAILEHLSDDVAWEYAPISHDVPWLQAQRGKAGAAAFFKTLAAGLALTKFDVKQLLGSERLVVAVLDLEGTAVRTGRTIREVDLVHVWHFDERGKVAKFRNCADTHAHWLAAKEAA